MRYGQIDATGLCVAVLETSGTIDAPHMIALADGQDWPLGKVWDGAAWGDAPPVVPSVPQEVSRSQGLIALDALGLLDAVETIVASAPRPVQIAWANEPMFSRDSPAINALWAALGKSAAELDALFIQAAAIRV